MNKSLTTEVAVLPNCDFCTEQAYADCNVPDMGWGNVCWYHFNQKRCKLGLGYGQRYVLEVQL